MVMSQTQIRKFIIKNYSNTLDLIFFSIQNIIKTHPKILESKNVEKFLDRYQLEITKIPTFKKQVDFIEKTQSQADYSEKQLFIEDLSINITETYKDFIIIFIKDEIFYTINNILDILKKEKLNLKHLISSYEEKGELLKEKNKKYKFLKYTVSYYSDTKSINIEVNKNTSFYFETI